MAVGLPESVGSEPSPASATAQRSRPLHCLPVSSKNLLVSEMPCLIIYVSCQSQTLVGGWALRSTVVHKPGSPCLVGDSVVSAGEQLRKDGGGNLEGNVGSHRVFLVTLLRETYFTVT